MNAATHATDAFDHEALLYAGDADFLASTGRFLRDGIAADEPALVVVDARKIDLLRRELADASGRITFVDMADAGRNPSRIIPLWRDWVDSQSSAERLRGIGEPVWRGRSSDELVECRRHEALLNVAFAGGRPWRLLCPYDVNTLDAAVIDDARRTHPCVSGDEQGEAKTAYMGLEAAAAPFSEALPEPNVETETLVFDAASLPRLRDRLAHHALRAGLTVRQRAELVFAVNELVTNSVRHGDGRGTLRMWRDGDAVVCETRNRGRIDDPLAGRRRPEADIDGPRGLWLVTQLCDLVQLRSQAAGAVVRVRMQAQA